jgi:hypothetical protein
MRYAVVIEKTQGNYSANEVELELTVEQVFSWLTFA